VKQAFITIVRNEWGMGSKMMTEMFFGPNAPPEAQRMFTQYQRAGATAEVAARMIEANYGIDSPACSATSSAPCW